MIITTTGYYSTGSSAVYDLLREYSPCTEEMNRNNPIEHIFLYMPNGLFDLEDKLLIGNSIHRSDEAMNAFYQSMKDLYDNNYQVFGNYKKRYGKRFMDAVEKLIEGLTEYKVKGNWYYDNKMQFSLVHTVASTLHTICKQPVNANYFENIGCRDKYSDNITRYAFPSETAFYKKASAFIREFFSMAQGNSQGVLLLDHLILPHNVFRLSNYLEGNELKVIIVDRDPRDVYIDIRKRQKRDRKVPPVPVDPKDFVGFWRALRESERVDERPEQVLRIQYEDLFYKYEETVALIEGFCGFTPDQHKYPGRFFNPTLSNTFLRQYKVDEKWTTIIKYFEDNLQEYLYKS